MDLSSNDRQIEVTKLGFSYDGSARILEDLSCSFAAGEKVAVLGHNGAGKTTFFNILAGILNGYTGNIKLNGMELKKISRIDIARLLAIVPQRHEPLFPYLTRDFILMGRYSSVGLLGLPSEQDLEIVNKAASDTGAVAFLDKPYSTLSGGEMQLALIARALAQEPEILILDEPSSHLDFKNRFVVMDLIRKVSEKRGVTLLMSLHEPNDVLQFADRALVLYSGKIVADGPPAEVLDAKLLADYFGVKVEVTRGNNGQFFFRALDTVRR